MKDLIRQILKEELLTEASGAFTKEMAVELATNILAYPESRTEKTYDYLGVVKGETAVGRLHFTTSGLDLLYKKMGNDLTEKYFDGKSVKDLQNFSEQKDGKEYKYEWWMDGMREFLNSRDSIPVQDEAIYEKFSKKFGRPKYGSVINKWSTLREFAIGMSLINSAPACFLRGSEYGWDAEEMMRDYCKGTGEKSNLHGEESGCGHTRGCRGRCRNVNKFYPPTNKRGYVWDGDQHNKYCA